MLLLEKLIFLEKFMLCFQVLSRTEKECVDGEFANKISRILGFMEKEGLDLTDVSICLGYQILYPKMPA